MGADDDQVYEFKGFRLEAAQRRLLYNGEPVPLKPKILDLLLLLVQMRGRLVEKDELMKEIWPNTIVEENNITVSMSILRKNAWRGSRWTTVHRNSARPGLPLRRACNHHFLRANDPAGDSQGPGSGRRRRIGTSRGANRFSCRAALAQYQQGSE